MALHVLTVELSDEEIAVLKQLAAADEITPNEALRKAIVQAGYLLQKKASGQKLYVGEVQNNTLRGNQIDLGNVSIGGNRNMGSIQ